MDDNLTPLQSAVWRADNERWTVIKTYHGWMAAEPTPIARLCQDLDRTFVLYEGTLDYVQGQLRRSNVE